MDNIVDLLEVRGLLDAVTHRELREKAKKPLKVYCGFDPTAESLHLGNMIALVVLSWFQRCGHTPVAVVGGATGLVGDPSGKSHERPLLDTVTLQKNLEGIRKNLEVFLDFEHPTAPPLILNNYDWFSKFSYIDFLRDVGKHFRMGPMLSKDSVKSRLGSEEGMSFTEFCYQTLQGYDFLHLYREEGVSVQIGGSDQWGNILAGTDLIRKLEGGEAFGLTFPLLTRSDGKKFGKSEGNAIWLSGEKLSPYQFYQYLYGIPDADVIKMFRFLTFLDLSEIATIENAMQQPDYVANSAQKRLAEEVTKIVHGEEGLKAAQKATESIRPGSEAILDSASLKTIAADIPSSNQKAESVVGQSLIDIMVDVKLQNSKGEARRLVRGGGCYLNNEKIEDESRVVLESDLIDDKCILLGAGKKKKLLLWIE